MVIKLFDWLFSSPYGTCEPEEMYTHTKITFKTSLRNYCGILTINNRDNTFQLKLFIGEPYFRDGTQKYLHEAHKIDESEWEPLENAKQVIDLAHKMLKRYEAKERALAYFKLRRNFILLKNEEGDSPPAKAEPSPKPVIIDHEEQAYLQHIKFLQEHPEEIDSLDDMERKQILKSHPEIRVKYYEWRALQSAQQRKNNGGDA